MKYCLVLSGGGSLGAFQAGVIYGLQKEGIEFSEAHGVSVGALNAAMVAQGKINDLYRIWTEDVEGLLSLSSVIPAIWRLISGRKSLVNPSRLKWLIQKNVSLEGLKMPCSVGATNTITGEFETFFLHGSASSEEMRKILLASASEPGILPSVDFGKYAYADGGLRDSIPFFETDKPVIVISCRSFGLRLENPRNIIEAYARGNEIRTNEALRGDIEKWKWQANTTVIEPNCDLGNPFSFKKDKLFENFMYGYDLAGKIDLNHACC